MVAFTIPAGTGEKLQYLVHDYNDNTVRFVLRYPGILDANALRRAAHAVIKHVDILHATFVISRGKAFWQVHADVAPDDYFSFLTTDAPNEAALEASLPPLPVSSKAQLHCTLAQSQSESWLTLRISHLCADGSDCLYLLKKLTEAYDLIQTQGHCRSLAVKNGDRNAEQVYACLTRRQKLSLLKSPLTGVRSAFPFDTDASGEKRVLHCTLPQDLILRIRTRAKADRSSFNDVLLTACYRALAMSCGDKAQPLSIMSMMDLRRYCEGGDSKGLSNLSGSLPTVLSQGVQGTFGDTLCDISAQTRAVKSAPLGGLTGMPILHGLVRTLPLSALLLAADRIYGSMSVGLTNMGRISCSDLALANLIPDCGYFGGPLKKKPALQVSAASFDDTCALCIYGEMTQRDAQKAQHFLDTVAAEITLYAKS